MDLVDMIAEKKFIGQDFLLWLWWKSEISGGYFNLSTDELVGLQFGGKMRLESTDENVICNGKSSSLSEARAGLAIGKKPEQAYINLEYNGNRFSVVFVASLFEFKSFQMPKVANAEDQNDEGGFILERIFMHNAIVEAFKKLLHTFLLSGGNQSEIYLWAFGA